MEILKNIPKTIKYITIIIVIFAVAFGIYCGNVLYIKKYGINIKPSQEIKPYAINVFLQNDSKWKDFHLGNSNYTIGNYGCLLSVIASSCDYLGYETNPKYLNEMLTKSGAYTSSGDIIWYKIDETVPNIIYEYKRSFNRNTIMFDLKNGYLPIVMVKYKKTGIHHWVLIVGSSKDDFLIIDPLNQRMEPIPLQTHGKVYAYRVLKNFENIK